MTTTVEFAVQISCDSCVTKIENSLKNVDGVKNIKISKDNGTVLVESNVSSSLLQEKIESTGRKAVLKGYGSDKGEREDFDFVKVEVDSSGCCGICKPSETDLSKSMLHSEKETKDADLDDSEENEKKDKSESRVKSDSSPQKKKAKSDDEEELELKYSSDSEDGDYGARLNAFNTSDGEDIWKIEDDLDADFDVIDADGDESEGEEKNLTDGKNDERQKGNRDSTDSTQATNKRINTETADGFNDSDDETTASAKKRRLNNAGNKFIAGLKACKVRKGDFNVLNTHIAMHVLMLPEKDGEHLDESEAQTLKDSLVKELFLRTQRVQAKEPGVFLLRFSDCKLVKPGWLLIHCDNKETFDWILSWEIPPIDSKTIRAIPALDKSPLQKIKFSLLTKSIPDEETMLKLIHLQNRDIDTKRWVLDEKKPGANGMDNFKFQVDFGSVRAIEKLNWSFFFELFTVKITEYNGKPVGTLSKIKNLKSLST